MTPPEGRLLYDSARTCAPLDNAENAHGDRMLVFHTDDLCVDLTIQQGSDEFGLVYGQIVRDASGTPVTGARVHLGFAEEPVTTDGAGWFSATGRVGSGTLDLRIETADAVMVCRIPGGLSALA